MSLHKAFEPYVQQGYVDTIPNGHLTIYNYTGQCMIDGKWDYYTMMARGLVLDSLGQIVARPFPKFFNIGEHPSSQSAALPAETPELADKLDGSLVIVFYDQTEIRWRAITRGCWKNKQIEYAEEWLKINSDKLDRFYTYMFELIGPWNRIVVTYKETEMVLIGIVHTSSALDFSYSDVTKYGETHQLKTVGYSVRPVGSVDLERADVLNEEGYVARFSNGFRVKLKYTQYMRLHKVLTGLSIKGIWEALADGKPINLESVPDEFLEWFNAESCALKDKFREIERDAQSWVAIRPMYLTRKEFAIDLTKKSPEIAGIVFYMLDEFPYAQLIWKRIKPKGHKVFKADQVS